MPKSPRQPKVRSRVAQAAWFRSSAGKMGGSAKQKTRRERSQIKQELRHGGD